MGKRNFSRTEKKETKESNFLNEFANDGFEGLDTRDFVIPFLKVLQKLHSQVDKDSDEYVIGAEPGLFYNTVSQKVYGKEIQVIPIAFQKTWIEWGPNRGGLINRHEPHSIKIDTTDFTNWRPEHAPENSIVENMCFFLLIIGHFNDGPILFPLFHTGIKHGRNWNTQIMMTRLPDGQRAPFYSSVWKLETILNKNDQGAWYQIGSQKSAITRVRFITAEEFKKYVFPLKNSIKQLLTNADFNQIEDSSEGGKEPRKKDVVPF